MFFIKMILVVKLNSEFYVKNVVDLVNQLKGHVITIICDNNRTNQALFKKCHKQISLQLIKVVYTCFCILIMYIYVKVFTKSG